MRLRRRGQKKESGGYYLGEDCEIPIQEKSFAWDTFLIEMFEQKRQILRTRDSGGRRSAEETRGKQRGRGRACSKKKSKQWM
jgi:hypothetical protein